MNYRQGLMIAEEESTGLGSQRLKGWWNKGILEAKCNYESTLGGCDPKD